MKTKLNYSMVFFVLITLIHLKLEAQTYSGGSGTIADPYLIANKTDLKYLSEHTEEWTKHFRQTADIVFVAADFQAGGDFYNSGSGFSPIGGASSFTGSYNGDDHTIANLFINRPAQDRIGLFGSISGISAIIKNLGLPGVVITGRNNTGGITGLNTSGNVTNCRVSGTISGATYTGGLVGYNSNNAQITGCHTEITVTATGAYCGGLVGINYNAGYIYNSYSSGTVTGVNAVGGLAGGNRTNNSAVIRSFSNASASGTTEVGGLAGMVFNGGIVQNSYAMGNIYRSSGTLTVNFGGLIGFCESGTIQYNYSKGSVSGNSGWYPVDKGFVGSSVASIFNYNYWDTETSGQSSSASQAANQVEGRTTVQMHQQSNYVTWDFVNTWRIDASLNVGYPFLAWQCNNPSDGGNIGNAQVICANSTPDQLIELTAPGGSPFGIYEYQWQFSLNGIDFTNIDNATGIHYSPSALAVNTWFKRLVKVTCETEWKESNIVLITVNQPSRRYVTMSGAGSQTGADWANAMSGNQLQAAMNDPCANEVWVAAGTYHPTVMVGGTTDRHKTFQMRNEVPVYGGFAGTETDISQRVDYGPGGVNETILSGDLNNDDNYSTTPWQNISENCYHVFFHPLGKNLNNSAILDGFTIKGGNADSGYEPHYLGGGMFNYGSSPTLNRITFSHNAASPYYGGGGAIYLRNSSPLASNITLQFNTSAYGGGIYLQQGCEPSLTNWLISDNSAAISGGGVYNANAYTIVLNNATIANNHAAEQGGGLHNANSAIYLRNCILWGNSAAQGNQICNATSYSIYLQYSCIANGTGDITHTGVPVSWDGNTIFSDPIFADPVTYDYRIKGISPCTDAGNDADNALLTDIRGNGFGRKLLKTNYLEAGTIDMGAYEYNSNSDPAGCTNPASGGSITGNQLICPGDQPVQLSSVTLPSGQAGGELEYQWQSSTYDETSGFTDIPSANSINYLPGPLNVTTWFKRRSRVSCMNDWIGAAESNVVEVTMKPVFSISGSLLYYKISSMDIPLNGITLALQDDMGNPVGIPATTSGGGFYSFNNVCPGDYNMVILDNPHAPGGINATDAAQTNWWSVNPYTIEQVRFQAGDGSFDWSIYSSDALAMQNYFVNGAAFARNINHYPPTPWTYFRAGALVFTNDNPGPPNPPFGMLADIPVSVTNSNITGFDIFALIIGDFNTSFNPSTGIKGSASESLLLTYGDTRQADAGAEIEIPVRLVHASELTAASLILHYPEELFEVTGVNLKLENGNLDWAAKGGELRIGWNSLTPLQLEAGSLWLSIQGKTSASFAQGDEIRFTLAPDLLNELADENFNVIPDAKLTIDVLAFSTTGTPSNDQSTTYNEQCTMNAHPNPFSGYSILDYRLGKEGHVTLEISDMLGRKAALLVDERQTAGEYTVKLDATLLQPGVYMATLKCGELVKSIKLVRNSQ